MTQRRKSHSMQPLSNLLEPMLRKQHIWRGVQRARVVVLWLEVVGEQVAAFSQATHFREGTLWVEVSDSETAMHLSYQRQHFLRVYREKFAISNIRDIRFRVGNPQKRRLEQTVGRIPDVALDDEGEEALAQLEQTLGRLELSPELAHITLNTARALVRSRAYRHEKGYHACRACQVLTQSQDMVEGLCFVCHHYRQDVKVQRASLELSQEPDRLLPLLSEDERRVAQLLAMDALEAQLYQLLPYVLADTSYRQPFTAAAHRYLAHKQGKALAEVSADDYAFLPLNMARVVGYW